MALGLAASWQLYLLIFFHSQNQRAKAGSMAYRSRNFHAMYLAAGIEVSSGSHEIGLFTRPEIKGWPDVKFCAHAQCVLPRVPPVTPARDYQSILALAWSLRFLGSVKPGVYRKLWKHWGRLAHPFLRLRADIRCKWKCMETWLTRP